MVWATSAPLLWVEPVPGVVIFLVIRVVVVGLCLVLTYGCGLF